MPAPITELDTQRCGWPDCRVWCLDLDALPVADSDCAGFSAFEQERVARLRRPVDARRYRAAHWGLRLVLAPLMRLQPAALQLARDAHGKPRLAHSGAPAFSLSHSDGVAVVAVGGPAAVGVDVERSRVLPELAELARAHLAPTEWAAWRALDPSAQSDAFLVAWTRKEAALKALGSGLHVAPGTVDVGPDSETVRWRAPAAWGNASVDVMPSLRLGSLRLAFAMQRGAAWR